MLICPYIHISAYEYLWNSAFSWLYLSLSPLLFTSLLFSAICKTFSDNHFAFCISFSWGWFRSAHPIQCDEPLTIVLQALCLPDLVPRIYTILQLYKKKKDRPAKGEIELNSIETKKWRVFKCWTDGDMMKPSVIGPYLNWAPNPLQILADRGHIFFSFFLFLKRILVGTVELRFLNNLSAQYSVLNSGHSVV